MRFFILLGISLLFTPILLGQSIPITKAQQSIKVDGILDDITWQTAQKAGDFQITYPNDSLKAKSKTIVQLSYDDRFLYVAATCYDEIQGDYVIQSLKRDFSFPITDAFAIFIDPFNDKTTGWSFALNPYAVQREGLVTNGGRYGVTTSWDGKWFGETKRYEDRWTLEMAIPFKTLRFKDADTWGINFARNDLKRNETSTWIPIPRGYNVANMAYSGILEWDKKPTSKGANIDLIPYAATGFTKDYESNEKAKATWNIGLDAKMAITTSLNLDVTINPDFSQVEVDRQVLDLSRFQLSFPERRTFFLENSDLFAQLGKSNGRPFFSRRIGLDQPILAGARLSGKINKDWRIGLMNIQTRKDGKDDSNPTTNHTVAVVQRQILKRSNITLFGLNKSNLKTSESVADYNIVTGAEFNYRSNDAKWSSKSFVHKAFTKDIKESLKTFGAGTNVAYRTSKVQIESELELFGKDYITNMGFVPRLYHYDLENAQSVRIGFLKSTTFAEYRFYNKKSTRIDYIAPQLDAEFVFNKNLAYQEHELEGRLKMQFRNNSYTRWSVAYKSPLLYYPFVLSGLNQAFEAKNHPNTKVEWEYYSSKRYRLYGNIKTEYGQYFSGKRFGIKGELNYRQTPWGSFGINFSEQYLHDYPEGFGTSSLTLIGSKAEISFNRNLFFTTFLQYNTQAKNFNINSRFQWRFKPMSDLFIVYTENYLTEGFDVKNRALVLKLNYWFSL